MAKNRRLLFKFVLCDFPRWNISSDVKCRRYFRGFIPKAGVPQGSNLSPLLFLICVNDMPNPSHHQTDKSQFADDASQWAVSKNIDLAVEYLQRDLDKLKRWSAKWRIKLNPEKTKVIIFSNPDLQ